MTILVLKNDVKLGNMAEHPGEGSSSMETESKCQVSNVSFKNLTAAFGNAAEGQGHSFSPGILLRVSSFTNSVSSPHSNQSIPVFGELRNNDVEEALWSFLLPEGKVSEGLGCRRKSYGLKSYHRSKTAFQ